MVFGGRLSCGLRNSASAVFEVESAETHSKYLVKTGVLIDMEERKRNIVRDSTSLAEGVGGCIVMDDNLLNEVANLVEAPVPVLGKFDESFLELPKDILIMVMQKHQRYFHLIDDSSNKLLPYFIAVANGVIDKVVVTKGNEAVLRARYEDAKFFYRLDIQKKFSEFRRELSGILFHEKLGTMLDKVSRIEKTVGKLSTALGLSRTFVPVLEEAAGLAMSDLATSVVTEFTSLAGIMGRHYALRDGYSQQVAESLFEITLPRFSGDALPKTEVGIVLAIADRLDSLVGLFGVGCQPSSTSDPFGLRRIAYGLVQVLVENGKNLDLRNALQLVAHVQPIKIEENILHDVHQFISRRLEQLLMEALAGGDLFQKVIEAYSRPTRIIRGKDIGTDVEVSEAAFESDEERALWSAYSAVESEIVKSIQEDERIRKNRLALLKKIADLPKGIADLSLLPGF